MKVFNAFQLTCCFAAAPFLIDYLRNSQTTYCQIGFWVALVAYTVGFVANCFAVHESL